MEVPLLADVVLSVAMKDTVTFPLWVLASAIFTMCHLTAIVFCNWNFFVKIVKMMRSRLFAQIWLGKRNCTWLCMGLIWLGKLTNALRVKWSLTSKLCAWLCLMDSSCTTIVVQIQWRQLQISGNIVTLAQSCCPTAKCEKVILHRDDPWN